MSKTNAQHIQKRESNIKIMQEMAHYMLPHLNIELKAIIFGTIGYIAVPALVVAAAHSAYMWHENLTIAQVALVIALLCATLRGLFAYLEQYYNHLMAFTILRDTRNKLFEHLRELAPARLQEEGRGNLVSVLTEDIELLEIFYAHTLSPLAIALITTIIYSVAQALVHPLLGLAALISYAILGLLLPWLLSAPTFKTASAERAHVGVVYTKLLESLDSLKALIYSGFATTMRDRLHAENVELLQARSKRFELQGINKLLLESVSLATMIVFAATAASLVQNGTVDPLYAVLASAAYASSLTAIQAVCRLGTGLQPTLAAAHRVFSLLKTPALVHEIVDGKDVDSFQKLQATGVSVGYIEQETVLEDIDFSIAPHQVLAIKGENGAGKTTFINACMRFIATSKGTISVNEISLDSLNTHSLRAQEVLVSQDAYIFSDTLANNLRVAKPNATDEEIKAALSAAKLDELVDSWSDGINHVLVRGGIELSDGQRQRISCARAFLSEAPLIFLDEPTANMDTLLEAELMQSLKDMQQKHAYVLISHRSTPLSYADSVYTLADKKLTKTVE